MHWRPRFQSRCSVYYISRVIATKYIATDKKWQLFIYALLGRIPSLSPEKGKVNKQKPERLKADVTIFGLWFAFLSMSYPWCVYWWQMLPRGRRIPNIHCKYYTGRRTSYQQLYFRFHIRMIGSSKVVFVVLFVMDGRNWFIVYILQ